MSGDLSPYRIAVLKGDTERLIHEIEISLCAPVTQLRLAMDRAFKEKLIPYLRTQDERIATLIRASQPIPPPENPS
jgi:hypothetical protein